MTKNKKFLVAGSLLAALGMGIISTGVTAKVARVADPVAVVSLTAAGEKLAAQYSDQLKTLQAEIAKALPAIAEPQQVTFLKAYQAESLATAAELKAMRSSGGKKVTDKDATAKTHEQAKAALALAATNALAPSKAILKDLEAFLASEKLDAKLAKYAVLKQATPQGLAAFAQQGKDQEALVEKLLADEGLMKQMIIADGALDGKYGQAMQIYTAIQKASPRAKDGVLQRLALGISLELAVPIKQTNPLTQTNAPAIVDPVKRYLHFEKAFLDGELDPAFKDLSVWDLRMVGNGDEPDEMLAWGREMLRNYRPDHITTADYRWRYVKAVKTDVQYGSQDQKNDSPSLCSYQNMINTGGVCGRRAFFGRFILRSFGIPTLARPQKGHATLVHWTPDGWVINLGAGWGWGWLTYGQDVDFLANMQARKVEKAYPQVMRAQCIGDVLGETRAYGFNAEPSGFWNAVALYQQRAIVEASKAVALAAVGTDIGEANVSKEKEIAETVTITDADKKIVSGPDGAITIPAVACSLIPSTNTTKIIFMKSVLGGLQMHYSRTGAPVAFEYAFDAPQAGKYTLSARVVTVSPNQHLLAVANAAKEPADIALPYTIGKWEHTQPVEITLAKGPNVVQFTRKDSGKGLTIKDFTLAPVK